MARSLPPLNWIRAFEAAARHQSFLRAAEELGVSSGAISQKIKSLELRLGVALFKRHPRGVELTEAGREYRDDLSPALDAVTEASDRIAAAGGGARLRVAALPAIAEKWLTPRLPRFHKIRPEFAVEVSVTPDISQLADQPFDLAIHYEIDGGRGQTIVPLFRDEMFPVCSPSLAEELDLREASDLLRCRLLYDTQWPDDWSLWFEGVGLPANSGRRESGFSLYSMAVEAAIEGLGVVIGHESLIDRDLKGGRLVAPFGHRVLAPHRYVAIVPNWSLGRRHVTRFLDWLKDEVNRNTIAQ